MNRGMLIVYYSWHGNTRKIAEQIKCAAEALRDKQIEAMIGTNLLDIHHADKGGGQILLVTGGRTVSHRSGHGQTQRSHASGGTLFIHSFFSFSSTLGFQRAVIK